MAVARTPTATCCKAAYLQRQASFLYLEQAGTLVLFYRGLSNYSGYLVAAIDTRQARFNLTPVRGTALLSRDALPTDRVVATAALICAAGRGPT